MPVAYNGCTGKCTGISKCKYRCCSRIGACWVYSREVLLPAGCGYVL